MNIPPGARNTASADFATSPANVFSLSETPLETLTAVIVTRLRCEYLVDPLGIDETAPRLSWCLESSRRGARQLAYRIRVASTPDGLAAGRADLWDSGRVESAETAHIAYAGAALRSRQTCHWNVEVWDETGVSVRSALALWTMGLLSPSDWSARWVAADPEIIRRDPQAVAPTLTDPGTKDGVCRLYLNCQVDQAITYDDDVRSYTVRRGS